MTSQTRCDLALVLCDGMTYAIPQDGSATAAALHRWATRNHAQYLDVVVMAGTILSGADIGGALFECDMYGVPVFIPREVLEDVN